jgi:hypothetical protein
MGGEKREKRKRNNNNLDITLVQLIRCYQALNEKTLRERCGQVGRTGEVKVLFQLCLGHPFHLAVENRVPAWSANIPQTKQKGIVSIQQQNFPPKKKQPQPTRFCSRFLPLTVCVRWRRCPCMLSGWRATGGGASSSVHWPIGHFQTVAVSFRAAKIFFFERKEKK